MNTKTIRQPAAINMMFWAFLVGLLIQAGAIFLLRQSKASIPPGTENIDSGLHLFNFLNL